MPKAFERTALYCGGRIGHAKTKVLGQLCLVTGAEANQLLLFQIATNEAVCLLPRPPSLSQGSRYFTQMNFYVFIEL